MAQYDFLVVGSGLFGAVFAHEAAARGKRVLVVEKRPHTGGNIYCQEVHGIPVHQYGAHIFHTSNKQVWDYVGALCPFNRYTNSPVASYRGKCYSLPFNMNTFYQLWGTATPAEAQAKLDEQRARVHLDGEPRNLEEQALRLVGPDIYEALIRGYTEKQWGRPCRELPAFIINRLPLRMIYDNNYFNDAYQGIPIGGYNRLIEPLLDGIEVRLETDYLAHKAALDALADKVVYTGTTDAYFDYVHGALEYRSLRFAHETLDVPNAQGVAVVNYTDSSPAYTRVIEHKHFEITNADLLAAPKTVLTREYPASWSPGLEPYYPVNNAENQALLQKYLALQAQETRVIFGGRLAEYKYYDMDKVIASALAAVEKEFGA
ncbi:MAG: UDP-galactopyranose mutase [Oscillospiraceae bacterium]|nr:UDP-galactopyranose mutase [Oscillospiraceae bacterium]